MRKKLVLIPNLQFSCYFNFGSLHLQLHENYCWELHTHTFWRDNSLKLQCSNTRKEFNFYNSAHIYSLTTSIYMHGYIDTRRKRAEWPSGLGRWILKSGDPWFKLSSTLLLSGFVLGSFEFNPLTTLCKMSTGQPSTSQDSL